MEARRCAGERHGAPSDLCSLTMSSSTHKQTRMLRTSPIYLLVVCLFFSAHMPASVWHRFTRDWFVRQTVHKRAVCAVFYLLPKSFSYGLRWGSIWRRQRIAGTVTLSSRSAMVSPDETNRAPIAVALMHWGGHEQRTAMQFVRDFCFRGQQRIRRHSAKSGPPPRAASPAGQRPEDRPRGVWGGDGVTLRWQLWQSLASEDDDF